MNKKSFLLASLGALAYFVTASADSIPLTFKYENPQKQEDGGRHVPPRVPSLYIEDGTLSFSTSCLGYTLELVRDGEVEFTYIITTTDDLVLPATLSGEYQLLLVGPSFTFEGIVEL